MSRWLALAVVLLGSTVACAPVTGAVGPVASAESVAQESAEDTGRVPAGSGPAAQQTTETRTVTTTARDRRSAASDSTPTATVAPTPTAADAVTEAGAGAAGGTTDEGSGNLVAVLYGLFVLALVGFLFFVLIPRYVYLRVRKFVRSRRDGADRDWGDEQDPVDRYLSEDAGMRESVAFFLGTARLTVAAPVRVVRRLLRPVRRVVGYPYRRYRRRQEERRVEAKSRLDAASEAVRDRDDGGGEGNASALRLGDARSHYQDGDYDEAVAAAEAAVDLAEREQAVRRRAEAVEAHEEDAPWNDVERVRERLSEARDALAAGDVDAAEDAVAEAERLSGPPVEYLLGEARQATDEARSAREAGALDAAIDHWEDAREKYDRALDRAVELDSDFTADIEESVETVDERLTELRREYRDQRLRDAAADAWRAVADGDEAAADGDFESAAEAYERAVERYETALDHARDHASAHTEDVWDALGTVQEALDDCAVAALTDRAETAVSALEAGDRDRAESQFREVLEEATRLDRDCSALRAVVRRGQVQSRVERARECVREAEAKFEGGDYYEAEEALDTASGALADAEDVVEADAQRQEITALSDHVEQQREHVERALTAVDEVSSPDPVEAVTGGPRVTTDDVPPPLLLCRRIPAAEAVRDRVGADDGDREQLLTLAAVVDDSSVRPRVADDTLQDVESCVAALESAEPVVGSPRLDDHRETLESAVVDAVTQLETELVDTLARLADSALPPDRYERPAVAEESVAADLREQSSLDDFTAAAADAVDRLVAALEDLRDPVSTLDTYESLVDRIESELDEGTVTAADLPVDGAATYLELYHREHPTTTFDADEVTLGR